VLRLYVNTMPLHIKGLSKHGFCYLFLIIHLFTCAYIVWVISPPCPLLPPSPPQFQAGPFLPLSLILLKKRHKHNKEDKVFLLVELKIAIQRDSYYCFQRVTTHVDSTLTDLSLHWFLITCS
jgi:hypothetical protein